MYPTPEMRDLVAEARQAADAIELPDLPGEKTQLLDPPLRFAPNYQNHLPEGLAGSETMTRAELLNAGSALTPYASSEQISRFLYAVNAWGYGRSGYGPGRTQRVAEADNFANSARHAISLLHGASDDAAIAAYFYLNNTGRVRGWGPSFFTKFLAFADPTNQPITTPGREPAQVLDRWTAQSMNWFIKEHQASPSPASPAPIALFKKWAWTTPQYAFYLRVLRRLARDPRLDHWASHGSHLATERTLFAYFRDGDGSRSTAE